MKEKGVLLIVDDDPDFVTGLSKFLNVSGYRIYTAQDGEEALYLLETVTPDLILLDITLPTIDGKELKSKLNENEKSAQIPVIFVSAKDKSSEKVEGLRLMADDYVTKPFELDEFLARVENTIQRHRQFREMDLTDTLTGLGNLELYQQQVRIFFEIARRYDRPFSLAVLDVDNLKKVNDSFGHDTGNRALQFVAETMKQTFRQSDALIRYGGDEFVVLFPENETTAEIAIGRFKKEMRKRNFLSNKGQPIPVSVSIGLAGYHKWEQGPSEIFEMADRMMYSEKLAKKALA